MKKLTLILLLIAPMSVFADVGFLGSGFGESTVNVQFCDSGVTHNGVSEYWNEANDRVIWGDSGHNYWKVSHDVDDVGSLYYGDASGNTLTHSPGSGVGNNWFNDGGGTPIGQFSDSDGPCPFGGGGSETASSTDSTDTNRILRTIAFGEGIIMLFFFIAFMGFTWNMISGKKKKKWQK